MSMRPPLPPFTHKTAVRKVRLADVLRTRSKLGIFANPTTSHSR